MKINFNRKGKGFYINHFNIGDTFFSPNIFDKNNYLPTVIEANISYES